MSKRSKKATMEAEEALGGALRLAIDRLQKGSMRYAELVDQIADAMTEPIDIKRAARLAIACGAVLQLVALGYARVDGNGNMSLGEGLMTRDQILQLEPGPEFNRLVAERVMGWEYDLLRDAWFKDGEGEIWAKNWHPSTDIAAAWRAVEALREKGFVIDILSCPEGFTVKI